MALCSEGLNRPIAYSGDDLVASERQMKQFMSAWNAHDLRLVFQRFQTDGMHAPPGTDQSLRELRRRQRPLST